MKVAILTITNGENYGNRLQNYAVQTTLESLGLDVETIYNANGDKNEVDKNSLKEKIKVPLAKVYEKVPKINSGKVNNVLRKIKFRKFNNNNIKFSKYKISTSSIDPKINSEYDYFVCGSDQVWNPEFYFNSEIDFLTFADYDKRIAYAPSFGVREIPKKDEENYKTWIRGIKYLSVREQAGANIIRNLTSREATILLDPTLMLSKEEWLKIAVKPKASQDLNRKFILTYFLGSKNIEIERKINNIARERNLKIINLLDINDKYMYSVDPSEFIWLINNCELMCTDSFHGAIFSIIMKTPFIVFERKSKAKAMNSRLETLLLKFNMECRLDKNIINSEQVFNVNFDNSVEIMKEEKIKTIEYLKNALNIN